MKINNIPEQVAHPFIVARYVDDELWYYGAYATTEKAMDVAEEVDGIMVVS